MLGFWNVTRKSKLINAAPEVKLRAEPDHTAEFGESAEKRMAQRRRAPAYPMFLLDLIQELKYALRR